MSNRWNPTWKIVKIVVDDKETEVCYDESSKLYVCPECSPECKRGVLPTYSSYFFNAEDLARHLKAHKYALWTKKVISNKSEIEIETQEEDEDEE
ncbi:hypothetical protein [Sulfuracidifex metallicus]|uniref:Uncharacterized protein n=1 Tax=Sulfuracidifex metallicus DSM 6482 = JCM 9184 TaxID=523847 RepID=A0A6A9QSG7_SULME|nr:hypothetical protein [Sulfuracidifex metallicus]MUN28723.1 hypothetical protein [Sulfuracidifex metallicus DSM 6482 = JCM 9184]WOE50756.1 hypothetical protein RQ359_002325 [Sulfuracidifex metallicus DSM 6482 = JCM 9184]